MPRSSELPTSATSSATDGGRSGLAARRASLVIFSIMAFLAAFYIFLKAYELRAGDPTATTLKVDFIVFWAAAKLALAGDALAAFDPAVLTAAAGLSPETANNLLWLYPPGFMALIAPLGLLPYWAAWSGFFVGSAACLALAFRGPARELPGGWRLVVVAPVVLIGCLAIGQNSVLWTAALVAALWAMRHDKAVLAGFWIALLTLKPQLGLLIPVALIAGREWRVLAWATGWAVALILISTAAFGIQYWGHFLAGLSTATSHVEQGRMPIHHLVSFYGFVCAIGASHSGALGAQLVVSAVTAVAIAWIWSRKHTGADLKYAALCAAIPLATPYAFYYEMTLTLAAAVFLVRDGFGRGYLGKLWLLIIWFGPVPALYLPSVTTIAAVTPPILVITVAICVLRVHACERSDPN